MSEGIRQAIATLQEELRRQLEEASETKRTINRLCASIGEEPLFADAKQDAADCVRLNVRRDQWYGQALATAMREYLLMRRAANQGPATVNEIHAALASGGYQFDTKDDENAKRGIRISLTKNTAIFHRLPNGSFGLIDWYPEAKARKEKWPEEGDKAGSKTSDKGKGGGEE